jgi:hypothetical protein
MPLSDDRRCGSDRLPIICAFVPQAPPRLKIVPMLIADGFLVARLVAQFLVRRSGALRHRAVMTPPLKGVDPSIIRTT